MILRRALSFLLALGRDKLKARGHCSVVTAGTVVTAVTAVTVLTAVTVVRKPPQSTAG